MPFNICDNTMRCALWIMSIGQHHHCDVIEQPKNKTFIDRTKFYGKY